MAKAKEKCVALELWAEYFSDLTPWRNQFLIKRYGGIIAGICLDETREPSRYMPKFFFHNLLSPFPGLSLSYNAAYSQNDVHESIKYDSSIENIVPIFKEQVPALKLNSLTMTDLIHHVVKFQRGIYLPHFFRDVITLGACFSSNPTYYRQSLNEAMATISAKAGDINMHIIGSPEKWRSDVEKLLSQDCLKTIESEAKKSKLPILDDSGFEADVVEKYWTFF